MYQLDAALESAETQKHGLVFIYDMSDSKYQNFDYDLSQKILTLLKVSPRIYFRCKMNISIKIIIIMVGIGRES